MTNGALIAFAAAGVFAVGDWIAVARGAKPLEYVGKPATLVALVAAAALLDPADPAQRAWFVAALVFSLGGDVFLMLPRDLFVFGLASFLVGHLAYVVGLNVGGPAVPALAIAAVAVALVAFGVGRRLVGAIRAGDHPELTAPVVAYIVVISAMVASALATGNPWAIGGALLFYVSDLLIGWNRFVTPLRWAPLAIIVTYHAGQAGLVVSLAA